MALKAASLPVRVACCDCRAVTCFCWNAVSCWMIAFVSMPEARPVMEAVRRNRSN